MGPIKHHLLPPNSLVVRIGNATERILPRVDSEGVDVVRRVSPPNVAVDPKRRFVVRGHGRPRIVKRVLPHHQIDGHVVTVETVEVPSLGRPSPRLIPHRILVGPEVRVYGGPREVPT